MDSGFSEHGKQDREETLTRTCPGYTPGLKEAMPSRLPTSDATRQGDRPDSPDRSSWPVWVGRVGDPQPAADYSALTPSQRIALCWEATKQAWTLSGKELDESAFCRDSESLSRRGD